MTNDPSNKAPPREWFINYYPQFYPHWHLYRSVDEAKSMLNGHTVEEIHVIEHSAYEKLKAENAELREEFKKLIIDADHYTSIRGGATDVYGLGKADAYAWVKERAQIALNKAGGGE